MSKYFILFVITLGFLSGCKKEVDHPPFNNLKDSKVYTVGQVIDLYEGEAFTITDSISVFATVTMDETDGNIYKNLYIQDTSGAVNLRMLSSADFFVGDFLRINLIGAVVDNYNGVMQISEVDPETKIIKQKSNVPIEPKVLSIANLNFNIVNQLIKLENVQFTIGDLNGTYAFVAGQSSKNITLEDCYGNSVLLRTSGFANFAGDSVAKGKGSIVLIVDRFNNDLQVKIRSISEVKMDGERCNGVILENGVALNKDFDDNSITSGGWTIQQITGSLTWETSTLGGASDPYAKISNYSGGNFETESWLISPKIQFEGTNPTLSFDNDVNYSGPQLQLMISADYDGISNPNGATWTDITASVSWDSNPTGWGFQNTGDIDLSIFSGQAVYIAYKYSGSDSDGSTWEVDEIIITG